MWQSFSSRREALLVRFQAAEQAEIYWVGWVAIQGNRCWLAKAVKHDLTHFATAIAPVRVFHSSLEGVRGSKRLDYAVLERLERIFRTSWCF